MESTSTFVLHNIDEIAQWSRAREVRDKARMVVPGTRDETQGLKVENTIYYSRNRERYVAAHSLSTHAHTGGQEENSTHTC